MGKSDRTAAIVLVLFSLFICQQSVAIGVGSLRQPGPGLLSFGAGTGVGILAFLLLIQSMISKESRSETSDDRGPQKGKRLLICFSLYVYAIALVWLGFPLSTFIFSFFVLRLIERGKWWLAVMKAGLITAGNYLFFVVCLKMSLPEGLLGW